MNYNKLYLNIIAKYGKTNKKEEDDYLERHHIVPLCIGGSNDTANLIYVSTRVHILLHLILWKCNKEERKLARAFGFMDAGAGRDPSPVLKELMNKAKSEGALDNKFALGNKSWTGKSHSDESKDKISKAMVGNKNLLGHKFEKKQCPECSRIISKNNFNQHKCFRER